MVHGARRETINFEGQEVKGQGHTRPKTALEVRWRHYSRPLRSSSFSSLNITKTLSTIYSSISLHACQKYRFLLASKLHQWSHNMHRQYSAHWSLYADRWWVGCYVWYNEEGSGRGRSPPRPRGGAPIGAGGSWPPTFQGKGGRGDIIWE